MFPRTSLLFRISYFLSLFIDPFRDRLLIRKLNRQMGGLCVLSLEVQALVKEYIGAGYGNVHIFAQATFSEYLEMLEKEYSYVLKQGYRNWRIFFSREESRKFFEAAALFETYREELQKVRDRLVEKRGTVPGFPPHHARK